MAGALERPVRDPVTPRMLEKVVWAGANLTSYGFSSAALCELAEVPLSAKQIRRMTSQVGGARVAERQKFVAEFKAKTLVERTTPKPGIRPPEVGVVMLDNGTHQRRDHFNNPEADTHWKQEAGGVVLSMTSQVHASDPCPDLPAWLVQADVVAEISGLAKREEHPGAEADHAPAARETDKRRGFSWSPEVVTREVIATTDTAGAGDHLEWLAWETGVSAAPRQAFVGDGAHGIWTLHKKHFSQMTGILDLMHALSYAYRAGRRSRRSRLVSALGDGGLARPRVRCDRGTQTDSRGNRPPAKRRRFRRSKAAHRPRLDLLHLPSIADELSRVPQRGTADHQ